MIVEPAQDQVAASLFEDERLSSLQGRILREIKKDLFTRQSAVRLARDVEGMRVDQDGGLSLGLRAGPSMDIFNLLHEIAHFLEIDERRLARSGWGLRAGSTVIVDGRPYTEPFTAKGPLREIRVFAIQSRLSSMYGVTFEADHAARLVVTWVPGSLYLPWLGRRSENGRVAWARREITRLARTHSPDVLRGLWEERCAIIGRRIRRQAASAKRSGAGTPIKERDRAAG